MKMRLFRRGVVITKKSNGRSVVGILWSRWFGIWTLKNAKIENGEGKLIKADGAVLILRENIDYIQRLP